jgi:hypothetical protein
MAADHTAVLLRFSNHFVKGVAYRDTKRNQVVYLLWDSAPPLNAFSRETFNRESALYQIASYTWPTGSLDAMCPARIRLK